MNLINLDIHAASQGTLPLMPDLVIDIDQSRVIAAPWVASDAPSWPAYLGPTDKDEDEDEDDEGDDDEDEDDEEYEDDEEDDEGDEDEDDEDEDGDDKEGGEPPKPTRRAAAA